MLQSARFRGDPVLEGCAAGVHRMLRPDRGSAVRKVQQGLLDLGYDLGPFGDDSRFGRDTGAAVTLFKTRREIKPNDPVVGPHTMDALDAEYALPYADRDEWLSWWNRPLPEWNFTRRDELFRRYLGEPFVFANVSQWLPEPFRRAVVDGLTALLDPYGSPDGRYTPSATWGASPLDLFHCHVMVDRTAETKPAISRGLDEARTYRARLAGLRAQARSVGPVGSAAWTSAYRSLLLAPGSPSVRQQAAGALNAIVAASIEDDVPLYLVWHSFEEPRWRPSSMTSADDRRHWRSRVAPVPGALTHDRFRRTDDLLREMASVLGLYYFVDRGAAITIMADTTFETSALVGLPMDTIQAAARAPQPVAVP